MVFKHWNPLYNTNKIEILTRDFKIPWSIQMQDFFVILDTYCIIKKIHFFNAIQLSVNQKIKSCSVISNKEEILIC